MLLVFSLNLLAFPMRNIFRTGSRMHCFVTCENNFSYIHRVIHTICPEWQACHPQGAGVDDKTHHLFRAKSYYVVTGKHAEKATSYG